MFRAILFTTIFLNTANTFKIVEQNKTTYCYATDDNPYKNFATKTAYEIIHGNNITQLLNCKPIQFWSINRHGTRLPEKKEIRQFKKLKKIQEIIVNNYNNEIFITKPNGLCEQDIELLKNWYWNNSIIENISSTLTSQGWDDLKNIAIRNKNYFPELLAIPYSEKDFLFRYTRTERTESSFKSYVTGLFGSYTDNIHAISFENDTLIKAYKYCKYWKKMVDENPEILIEYNKLINSSIYNKLISDVSRRLGFKYNLKHKIVQNIYGMCRFQQAWYVEEKSNWCAAFTKANLEILEYAEDLLYYYAIGHGMLLNKKVGCMPLKDMMERFTNIINGSTTEPKSVHYFTHSSAIQLLMTAMKMNKDPIPLTADNMADQNIRKWRTSVIGPFATNLNVVLYNCSKGDSYQVGFYLNEKIYEFEGCKDGVCSWDFVKVKFGKIAEECNLDFCRNDGV